MPSRYSVAQLARDFNRYSISSIKAAFSETFFYAPTYFAFQKMIDNGKLDPLKQPRLSKPSTAKASGSATSPTATRGRGRPKKHAWPAPPQLHELGQEVGAAVVPNELQKEIAWVQRKLGELDLSICDGLTRL